MTLKLKPEVWGRDSLTETGGEKPRWGVTGRRGQGAARGKQNPPGVLKILLGG